MELHFKGVDSEAWSHSKANYGKFFFLFSGPKISQIFSNPVKEMGKLFFELCFTKCLLSNILLFYDFQCHCRNVVQGIGRNQEEFFFQKKKKKEKNWKE